jgi:GT2 family glycosyltransferase
VGAAMSFSIIIPSRNAANLVPCIRAIREAGETARIIVVDDGVDWGNRYRYPGENEVYVDGIKPFVFARNVNIGIQAAGDDDVVILNDDALLREAPGFSRVPLHLRPGPQGFKYLWAASRTYPEVGIIGATTNLTGQSAQQPSGQGLRIVPHFAFVCVYIPRRTIDQVGMLDERYCLDYGVEDRDYCEAVNRAGLKCAVHDFCFVDHASLTSTYRGDPHAGRSFAKNYELFKQKWGIA